MVHTKKKKKSRLSQPLLLPMKDYVVWTCPPNINLKPVRIYETTLSRN